MTVMLHDKGLSTDIDWQNKDCSGKSTLVDIEASSGAKPAGSRVSNATERNKAIAGR